MPRCEERQRRASKHAMAVGRCLVRVRPSRLATLAPQDEESGGSPAVARMTPATTFAGRTVALFGLGGSGLATALRAAGGGARGRRLRRQRGERWRRRAAQGIATADLRAADWSRFAALVLSPGVPLTHPEPHWSARLAKAAGVEIIGDIELFCRERAQLAPERALRRHHRHQRQVDDDGARRAHPARRPGRDVQMGGNIGTADPVARAAGARTASTSSRCRRSRSTSRRRLKPTIGVLLNVSPDHLDRHGTMEHYAAIKERLVAARRSRRRRRRRRVRAAPSRAPRRRRQPAAPHLDRAAARDGVFADGASLVSRRCRRPGGLRRSRRHRLAARHAQRPERGGRGRRRGSPSASPARRSAPASRAFRACRIAWRRSAGADARSSSTIRRRRTPIRPRRRWPPSSASSGSSAARRRRAASTALRPYFPKIDQALISSARRAMPSPRTLERRGALSALRHARQGGRRRRRATPRARARRNRSCCSRRPARPTTSSRISRCAATASASSCGRCRASR